MNYKLIGNILGKVLLALVFLPCFLFAAVAAAPLWLVSGHIVRGLKDKAFARTARFGVKFAGTLLMVIVWALVFFLCLPWKAAVIAFILAAMSHRFFYASLNFVRILVSDIRLLDEVTHCVSDLQHNPSMKNAMITIQKNAESYFSEIGREIALN